MQECGQQQDSNFFNFPTWYKYLETEEDVLKGKVVGCTATFDSINDIWDVLRAVLEILLRLGTFVAIGFIIYGGIQFMMSQGSPEKIKQAKDTVSNALLGLAITILASAIVVYGAGLFS